MTADENRGRVDEGAPGRSEGDERTEGGRSEGTERTDAKSPEDTGGADEDRTALHDVDRDRGVLTPADRAYLLGEAEMSHEQSKRNAEARIRRRITDAVIDFRLIVNYLSRKDRRQVFQEATADGAFLHGVTAMLAFAYLGLKEQGVDFERVLVPAVRSAEEAYAVDRRSANVSVDVTFDVETAIRASLADVAARIEDDEPVTPRELFTLLMDGEYDVTDNDRVRLVLTGESVGKPEPEFVERIAAYLEAEVRFPTEARAVLRPTGRDERAGDDHDVGTDESGSNGA